MKFILSGFKEGDGLRRFAFECTGAVKGSRTVVFVGADVSLARKHGIRLQELPLICLRLLETLDDERVAGPITLTEDRMIAIQAEALDAAEKRSHRTHRRPSAVVGQAWRTTHQ